jgi:hypothetical protein
VFHALSVNSTLSKRKSRINLLADEPITPPITPTNNLKNGPMLSPTNNANEMHVPYLNSKLTHVMKDMLGGNCKTAIILTLAPEADSYHPNLITLQNIAKATKILNHPKVNKIAIPEDFLADEFSDLTLMGQLRQYYVEPLLKAHKSFHRKANSFGGPGTQYGSMRNMKAMVPYNLCLRSIIVEDLPEIAFPMLPWMKLEVGSNFQRTPR